MAYTVGEVAALAHISIRTLHHYDRIGLLTPSSRSSSGYRLYSEADLSRLQQALFYREIDMPLKHIDSIMKHSSFDPAEALIDQKAHIQQKIARLSKILETIDKTLLSYQGRYTMNKEEMFEVFGDFDPSEHDAEASKRWGDSELYRESARRTKGYSKEQWLRIKRESGGIEDDLVVLMHKGVPAEDPRVIAAAERHRLHIDKWFYPCSPQMHVELGEMYVSDDRFAKTYESRAAGLAQYLCDAIVANGARVE